MDHNKVRSAIAVLSCALFLGVASVGPAQAENSLLHPIHSNLMEK